MVPPTVFTQLFVTAIEQSGKFVHVSWFVAGNETTISHSTVLEGLQ